jgi:primosomal protein N' (replication factor Y)
VPFGNRRLIGVCLETVTETSIDTALKPIDTVIDTAPIINKELLELLRWAAAYYHHPLGEVVNAALPALLREGRATSELEPRAWARTGLQSSSLGRAPRQLAALNYIETTATPTPHATLTAAGFDARVIAALVDKGLIEPASGPTSAVAVTPPNLTITDEQRAALATINADAGQFAVTLLHGITGSGKTEVYLSAIESLLQASTTAQALVLIPEIALTPQTVGRFRQRFGTADAFHSGLTDSERALVWQRCRTGKSRVLIGTRSAVFTAFQQLALIVVDEEHDGSFKQQDGFRYSARDVAVKRAQALSIPLVLGTATPALETLHNAERSRYRLRRLTRRAGEARPPELSVIDIRGQHLTDGLSDRLISAVRNHLALGNQVLLFINRRGYAPTLLCSRCGWNATCHRCDSRLTLHRTTPELRCHHCDARFSRPTGCPDCSHDALMPVGAGTQRTEEAVVDLFPDVPVVRIDRDTSRSSRRLLEHLERINSGEAAVLVGTQMLAKGHHFPAVTLVGILNADAGFFSADFRAPEHTAQLIIQVAGRAGRAERPGEVWIQTYNPDNPMLQALVQSGYDGFAREELRAERPPRGPDAALSSAGGDPRRCSRAGQRRAVSRRHTRGASGNLRPGNPWPRAGTTGQTRKPLSQPGAGAGRQPLAPSRRLAALERRCRGAATARHPLGHRRRPL